MNRLKGVKESNGAITEYEFDSFGNISKEYTLTATGIKTTQYEYDGNISHVEAEMDHVNG